MEEISGESLEESLVEESLEVELWRSIEDQSWRRHLGCICEPSRKQLGDIWESFGKHFEFIWYAFGRHLEGWRLRKHLGGIQRSDLTKVQHFSAIM